MSGVPRCASSEPSVRRTSACTIDWGCTTTSMRSYGTPNSRCASITSRPLFIRVAESIVMRAPIAHVGWRSASATEMSASSARERPRNGPPEAVTISDSTASGDSPRSSWCSAECSESTGSSAAPAARRGGQHQRAAGDEALLVRERDVDAGLERLERRGETGDAHAGVQHDVGVDLGREAGDAVERRARERRAGARRGLVGQRDRLGAVPARQLRRARDRSCRPRARRPGCPGGTRRCRGPGGRSTPSRRAGRGASLSVSG